MFEVKKYINIKLLFIIFTSVFFLTIVGIVVASSSYALNNVICDGVKIFDIDLSGLKKNQAKILINEKIKNIQSQPILTITFANTEYKIMNDDIDWKMDSNQLAQSAYDIGRTGNLIDKIKERIYTYNKGRTIVTDFSYNENKLKNILYNITKNLSAKPQNATIEIINGKQKITPEIDGVVLDYNLVLSTLQKAMKDSLNAKINLPAKITKAQINKDDLANITDVLASYTTYFNPKLFERTHNVKLASDYLDGALIKPNGIYSFNKGIGPRNVAMGYKDAPVYIGEEVVPGIGGGICQVSTTLYNAVLFSNLPIIERDCHIRPVPYVPIGQDATIAGDFIDLKFKNNTLENIYIKSTMNYDNIKVEILGKKPDNFPTIKIVTDNFSEIKYKTIIKEDEKIPIGKKEVEREGENGYKVTTYRLKYLNGKLIETEKLYDDHYPDVDEIIKVGPKLKEKETKKDENIKTALNDLRIN